MFCDWDAAQRSIYTHRILSERAFLRSQKFPLTITTSGSASSVERSGSNVTTNPSTTTAVVVSTHTPGHYRRHDRSNATSSWRDAIFVDMNDFSKQEEQQQQQCLQLENAKAAIPPMKSPPVEGPLISPTTTAKDSDGNDDDALYFTRKLPRKPLTQNEENSSMHKYLLSRPLGPRGGSSTSVAVLEGVREDSQSPFVYPSPSSSAPPLPSPTRRTSVPAPVPQHHRITSPPRKEHPIIRGGVGGFLVVSPPPPTTTHSMLSSPSSNYHPATSPYPSPQFVPTGEGLISIILEGIPHPVVVFCGDVDTPRKVDVYVRDVARRLHLTLDQQQELMSTLEAYL